MLAARIQACQAQQAMTNQIAQETQLLARRELFQRDLAQRLQANLCGMGTPAPPGGPLNTDLLQRLASQAKSLTTPISKSTPTLAALPAPIIVKPEVAKSISPPISIPIDTSSNRSSPVISSDSTTSNIHNLLLRKIQNSQLEKQDTKSSISGKFV